MYVLIRSVVMDFLYRLRDLIVIFLINATLSQSLKIKNEFYKKNQETCMRIGKQPFFEIDLVLGKPWRIYYSWNLKLDTKCLDMTFRNATVGIVNRVWADMNEYLEQQPVWEAATLSLTMGPSKHELLLFADQGPAGSFLAVPNVARDANLAPARKGVPLMKFQLKLLNEGQYLLFVDCQVGVASLGARSDHPPYRSEIAATVAGLKLGDGFPACIKEKNKDEQFLV